HVQLYKNNTDFHGHSYGCHDNYLLPRRIPFSTLAAALVPFLVSRQLVAGAGKVGIEGDEGRFQPGPFQLSQRADFMETELSVDTMRNRPIVNTRDEPHADRARYRRLHLILGDANMCEYATALKVGTTRVVLDLIERGEAPAMELEDPVLAIKQISRESDLKQVVRRKAGGTISGLELQAAYQEAASRILSGQDPETDWVLHEWSEVLRLLREDRSRLIGRIDWVTKLWLLEAFVRDERLEWNDPWLASLDLEYHNLNPERGLFLGLEAERKTVRLVSETEIARAWTQGPSDTRAGIRGQCIRQFPDRILSVQWERIRFSGGAGPTTLDMDDLFETAAVRELGEILATAASPEEALTTWHRRKEQPR
ncbi:MAG: proteasome accessory factor PafA2 family protein, partial [Nitrospirota bacterium]|nr:proteasome accessory factor PafA2 family protein [Nitrospirota bacterium]